MNPTDTAITFFYQMVLCDQIQQLHTYNFTPSEKTTYNFTPSEKTFTITENVELISSGMPNHS
jgi:hypothetical protein